MFLSEILGAQQAPLIRDDFSGTTLGQDNQIEVLGWCGRHSTHKLYVVFCRNCAEDAELYGDGHFKSQKHDLKKGKIPCGCSGHSWKTEDQWRIIATRKASALGYEFIGWKGEFKGNPTKCVLVCPIHGQWESSSLSQLHHNGTANCTECKGIKQSSRVRKPDSEMIESFLINGCYDPLTTFKRSEVKNKQGNKRSWEVYCPRCDSNYISDYTNLQKGSISCECGSHAYTECYINLISDNNIPICIKFGVSKNSERRLKEQDKASCLSVTSIGRWKFEHKEVCKMVELTCLHRFVCGVISPNDLPDGFTETTSLANLDEVIEIYETNGGVRQTS